MLLNVEKGIAGKICHAVCWYAKANDKYMKYYVKDKESSYLKYWDINNLYRWAISQKFPEGGFKWVKNTSQFSKDFFKN